MGTGGIREMTIDKKRSGRMLVRNGWIKRSAMAITGSVTVLFLVQAPLVMGQQTADTTKGGNATFDIGDGRYTITSTGIFAHSAHRYGAIYQSGAVDSGEFVQVTIDSQENTRDWAKTGLMLSSDVSAGSDSAGDVVLAVTPGHGIHMQWDGNGDGFVGSDGSAGAGETIYPVTLRLERLGEHIQGFYSTDGGDSFTKVGTAEVPALADAGALDAGLVQTSGNNQRGTAEFSGVKIRSMARSTVEASTEPQPLPDDADALDRIVFGNAPSEENHDFAPAEDLTRKPKPPLTGSCSARPA